MRTVNCATCGTSIQPRYRINSPVGYRHAPRLTPELRVALYEAGKYQPYFDHDVTLPDGTASVLPPFSFAAYQTNYEEVTGNKLARVVTEVLYDRYRSSYADGAR